MASVAWHMGSTPICYAVGYAHKSDFSRPYAGRRRHSFRLCWAVQTCDQHRTPPAAQIFASKFAAPAPPSSSTGLRKAVLPARSGCASGWRDPD